MQSIDKKERVTNFLKLILGKPLRDSYLTLSKEDGGQWHNHGEFTERGKE